MLSRCATPHSVPHLLLSGRVAGAEIATRGEGVYSFPHPNGDCFPLLIFFLCNAYRHLLTFAKWHLRVFGMLLSNVLWANKETVLRRSASGLCGVSEVSGGEWSASRRFYV
jgi:hypothetical protein